MHRNKNYADCRASAVTTGVKNPDPESTTLAGTEIPTELRLRSGRRP